MFCQALINRTYVRRNGSRVDTIRYNFIKTRLYTENREAGFRETVAKAKKAILQLEKTF